MSERIQVCATENLAAGDRIIVSAGEVGIGVFNVDGDYYAISNACAHEYGPVCTGKVGKQLVGEFQGPDEGVVERLDDKPCISCPWHGWEYDLETGIHLGDDDISIPTFDVVVEDGIIYVEP